MASAYVPGSIWITVPGPAASTAAWIELPGRDHVTVDHISDDPRDEHIAPRLRGEPALPLELVQRLRERVSDDARGPPERRSGDPARQHRRCYQHTLCLR